MNSTTIEIGRLGHFISNITQLTPNTSYCLRAYVTNNDGTSYGNEISFTTSQIKVPILTTAETSSITQTSATSGGNIADDNGDTITARGICWSASLNPTIALTTKTSETGTTGTFISSITGLSANTIYYVKAYATNSAGTAYGNEISFTTSYAVTSITDLDLNVYNTITIGTQTWMMENLKTTKFNDNTSIPLVTAPNTWAELTTSAYCYYNNDVPTFPSIKVTYGALYNWFTVNSGKLCPTGWHVPTDAEWTTLTTYLGGENVAGGKLKETGISLWQSPNTGATNETGFSSRPGGLRDQSGSFGGIGGSCYLWSATEINTSYVWARYLYYSSSVVNRGGSIDKQFGFSVRCLQNK